MSEGRNILALFYKGIAMSGKKYFYALGQRTRAWGLTKDEGMKLYKIDAGEDYARIAFDAGYRGLSL